MAAGYDLELMVLRQSDSMVVATMVPMVGAEITVEEMASTEGQAPEAVASAHGVCSA